MGVLKWEKRSVCSILGTKTQTHKQNKASAPHSLWDEEFQACCCQVTNSKPLPTQPSAKHTHKIKLPGENSFEDFFLKSTFCLQRGWGGGVKTTWNKWNGSAHWRKTIQPASPGKRIGQSVQNWPSSAAHAITQPLVAWSHAYSDKHESATCAHTNKFSWEYIKDMGKTHTAVSRPVNIQHSCDWAVWQEKKTLSDRTQQTAQWQQMLQLCTEIWEKQWNYCNKVRCF